MSELGTQWGQLSTGGGGISMASSPTYPQPGALRPYSGTPARDTPPRLSPRHLQLSVPSPGTAQSLCAGLMRASVAQRPGAAGSPHHRLQPPPRPDSGTPGWGQCVRSGRGGAGDTRGPRGPGKGLRAGERGRRGRRSPACGDRCGGSPVIGRDTHYKYGRS